MAAGVLACVQQGANQLTIQSMTWCIVDLGGFGNTVGICKIAAWVKRYIRLWIPLQRVTNANGSDSK